MTVIVFAVFLLQINVSVRDLSIILRTNVSLSEDYTRMRARMMKLGESDE